MVVWGADTGGALRPVAAYRYDALGLRVETVKYDANGINPVTTRFYYDCQNVVAEYDHYVGRPNGSQRRAGSLEEGYAYETSVDLQLRECYARLQARNGDFLQGRTLRFGDGG